MGTRIDANSTGLRSLHNEFQAVSTNINAEIAQDLYTLGNLYNLIFFYLRSYMDDYSKGSFSTFVNSLSEDVVINITTLISNFDLNDRTILDNPSLFKIDELLPSKYHELSEDIVDTLKQVLTDRIRINALQAENKEFVTFKEILENPIKLNQYIQDVQRTSYLFSAEATFDQPIELKLWYKVYLERYGPPGDGVFDTELLGQIIQDLINAELINEDDVLL